MNIQVHKSDLHELCRDASQILREMNIQYKQEYPRFGAQHLMLNFTVL